MRVTWAAILAASCGGFITEPLRERPDTASTDTGGTDAHDSGDASEDHDSINIPDSARPDTGFPSDSSSTSGHSSSGGTASGGSNHTGSTSSGGAHTGDTSDSSAHTGDTSDSSTTPPVILAWDVSGWTSDWTDALTIQRETASTDGFVRVTLTTSGVGAATALYMADTRFTKDYDEEHTLAEIQSDPAGAWARYRRTLTTNASWGSQQADVDTVSQCNDVTPAHPTAQCKFSPLVDAPNFSVTYAAAVWEVGASTSSPPADCIVFGQDPSVLLSASPPSGLNLPAWLSAANCRNVN